jgi:hypothetical protein
MVMMANDRHADLASIVEADRGARRDVEDAQARLVAREAAELQELGAAHEAAVAAARADLQRQLEAIDAAARQRTQMRTAEREKLRQQRRARAREAIDTAAADYVRIVRGTVGNGSMP